MTAKLQTVVLAASSRVLDDQVVAQAAEAMALHAGREFSNFAHTSTQTEGSLGLPGYEFDLREIGLTAFHFEAVA